MASRQRTRPKSRPKSRLVAIRMSEEELAALERLARHRRYPTKAAVLRALIRREGDLLEPDKEQLEMWKAFLPQLLGASRNLNQLARRANAGFLTWGEPERATFAALLEVVVSTGQLFRESIRIAETQGDSRQFLARHRQTSDPPEAS